MPKKKTLVRESLYQRRHTATQSPFEGEDACSGSREGDETNRSGGPAKGEDNRHWSWSSSLRAVTMMGSPKSGGSLSASVYPGGFRFAAYGQGALGMQT
jgi:hypothetical protein